MPEIMPFEDLLTDASLAFSSDFPKNFLLFRNEGPV